MPDNGQQEGFDGLAVAAILAVLAVAIVALTEIVTQGGLEPGVLALLVAMLGPLVPALIDQRRRRR